MDAGTTSASPSALPLVPPAVGRRDYAAWVEGIGAAAGSRVLVLEAPVADALARWERARAEGVERIVCGFLPDELRWPGYGWSEAQGDFVARMEFTPYRFDGVAPCASADDILVLSDASSPSGRVALAGALGESCSIATARSVRRIDAGSATDSELMEAIARSAWVIHDVRDWSLGFAIDEFAAQIGRRCVRLIDPGYSPFRAALLDQLPPPSDSGEILRLRPVLSHAEWTLSSPSLRPLDTSTWFGGREASACWRHWMGAGAYQEFWADWDARRVPQKTLARLRRWHERPDVWAALASALGDSSLPSAAKDRLESVLAERLAADLRERFTSWTYEQAVPRWIMRHPKILERLGTATGESAEARKAVTRWFDFAFQRARGVDAQLVLLRHAAWAVDLANPQIQPPVRLRYAWTERWGCVPTAVAGDAVLPAALRAVCLDAFARRDWIGARGDRSEMKSVDALLAQPEWWSRCFGGAAWPLRFLGALRHARVQGARRVVRDALAAANVPSGARIFLLARVVIRDASELDAWLRQLVRQDTAPVETILEQCVTTWLQRRRWEIWRFHRPAGISSELRAAIPLVRTRARSREHDPGPWRLLANFHALLSEGVEAARAMAEFLSRNHGAAEVPYTVARALAMHGKVGEARAILARSEPTPQDPPGAWFARAVAAQLAGDHSIATHALTALTERAPRFLDEFGPTNEPLWTWGSVVMLQSGNVAQALMLRARALAISPLCAAMFDDGAAGTMTLAPGWMEFFAPALTNTPPSD